MNVEVKLAVALVVWALCCGAAVWLALKTTSALLPKTKEGTWLGFGVCMGSYLVYGFGMFSIVCSLASHYLSRYLPII